MARYNYYQWQTPGYVGKHRTNGASEGIAEDWISRNKQPMTPLAREVERIRAGVRKKMAKQCRYKDKSKSSK